MRKKKKYTYWKPTTEQWARAIALRNQRIEDDGDSLELKVCADVIRELFGPEIARHNQLQGIDEIAGIISLIRDLKFNVNY